MTSSLQYFNLLMLLFVLWETLVRRKQNYLWKRQTFSPNLTSEIFSHKNDHIKTQTTPQSKEMVSPHISKQIVKKVFCPLDRMWSVVGFVQGQWIRGEKGLCGRKDERLLRADQLLHLRTEKKHSQGSARLCRNSSPPQPDPERAGDGGGVGAGFGVRQAWVATLVCHAWDFQAGI